MLQPNGKFVLLPTTKLPPQKARQEKEKYRGMREIKLVTTCITFLSAKSTLEFSGLEDTIDRLNAKQGQNASQFPF